MTYTPSLTTPDSAIATSGVMSAPSLESRLQAALEHARRLTEMRGTADTEVAIAWETVEELQVALYRRKQATPNSLEQYCATNPDAPECRIYED